MKIRGKLDERPERGTLAWLKPALVSARRFATKGADDEGRADGDRAAAGGSAGGRWWEADTLNEWDNSWHETTPGANRAKRWARVDGLMMSFEDAEAL